MKKMKIAGLLLACALPFTANAADVCLKVNDQMFLKFKKPALTKGTAAQIIGTLVVPAAGLRPVMSGAASGFALIHSDGRIDYVIQASTGFLDDNDSYGEVYFGLRNADKKTLSSGTMVDYGDMGSAVYLYDATVWNEEYGQYGVEVIDGAVPQLSSVSCKTLPAF
jgi:hypothetical protein